MQFSLRRNPEGRVVFAIDGVVIVDMAAGPGDHWSVVGDIPEAEAGSDRG